MTTAERLADINSSVTQGLMVSVGLAATSTARSVIDVAGVACVVYEKPNDPNGPVKLAGFKRGLKLVVARGYTFPGGITFYATDNPQAQTQAWQRTAGGVRQMTVMMSTRCLNNTPPPGQAGVAHKVGKSSLEKYLAAVTCHELGHCLHEMHDEVFFWERKNASMESMKFMVDLAIKHVSQYSCTSAKELVAEVFCGRMHGCKYPAIINDMYASFRGP